MSIKTVSIETAKLLKAAGFRQDTYFLWKMEYPHEAQRIGDPEYKLFHFDYAVKKDEGMNQTYYAPTTDELLEELPYSLRYLESDYWLWITKMKHDGYEVRYTDAFHRSPKKVIQNDILPEALAQCWLYLKKEGVLNGT